jgi:branched-chain amino acid aminotransferase
MAHIYDSVFFGDKLVPAQEANLSIATSAVLYGLSVYTVFPIHIGAKGERLAFRLSEHYERLVRSARIIGIDTFEDAWPRERFDAAMKSLIAANAPTEDVFARVTVHVSAQVAGTRSRGLESTLSAFLYPAAPIVPPDGARLKTSVWRRVPDYAIPSRAKVNGAYVNSVLAKQDALDCGYDDCIFLDIQGHVCELSAANIFIVRDGALITPGPEQDLLEGITRRTIIEIARDAGIAVIERTVDLTELYIADEVFATGTSANIAPVIEIDARRIKDGAVGPITAKLRDTYRGILRGTVPAYRNLVTVI